MKETEMTNQRTTIDPSGAEGEWTPPKTTGELPNDGPHGWGAFETREDGSIVCSLCDIEIYPPQPKNQERCWCEGPFDSVDPADRPETTLGREHGLGEPGCEFADPAA